MLGYLLEQWKTFLAAITFLTRIPCGGMADENETRMSRSLLYYPLVGALLGGLGAIVYFLVSRWYSHTMAAIFAVAATVIFTGAFHEDAFADVCDAFGGMTPTRRLEIMRDSRVGSFGVTGLVLMIAAKVGVLASMSVPLAMLSLVAAHAMARWSSFYMIRRFPRIAQKSSLVDPLTSHATIGRLIVSATLAVACCLPLGFTLGAVLLLVAVIICHLAGAFFRKWLGGISGDCLGAVTQITELVCYLVIAKTPFR